MMGQQKSKKNKKVVAKKEKNDDIWVVGDQQERERIREFWAGLDQQKRRALVMLEKEAVLKKMKEQQKQTCSCSVCGRRRFWRFNARNDIESQMEFLYNSYYQELESFANIKQKVVTSPQVLKSAELPSLVEDNSMDEFDDELSDPDDFSPITHKSDDSGISEFGSSLTVQGGILTVADDFLKNDGRKFLDLMEQLSQRSVDDDSGDSENDVDWDDRDDDSNSDEYDEDEQIHNSEHQRMEETRRMFQIFAAKMFEQRVLTAYREKAASDRAAKLMQELEEEENQKKAKDQAKQKKIELEKEKKRAIKLKQEQEKAALEQERIKQEELIAQKKEDERIKQQQLLEEQEMARIAEKERQDAKLLEKKRKKELKREEKARKEEERLKLEAEELAKQEAKVAEELSIKLALDRAELERAEILAREAQKAAEQKIILEQAAYKNKEAEKKEREAAKEVQKRDRELAKEAEKRERDAAKLAEKVHSRTLADEHSKKLKVRLETRATREQAQNARIKLKEKKATKVSEAMRSNVIPSSTPASLGLTETSLHEAPHFSAQTQPFARGFQNTPPQNMTPSVMQFFHNTNQSDQHISVQTSAPNSGYPQTGVSKLGVSLQSTLPPSLGNLWKDNSIPSQNADPIIPQQNHSPWASASFTRPPPLSVGRDTSTLYVDEDSVFNKIQAEIRRNETEEVTSQPWAGGPPQRLSRTGPPGFSNFGFPVEDLSVKNDVWKTGSGGRYNFK